MSFPSNNVRREGHDHGERVIPPSLGYSPVDPRLLSGISTEKGKKESPFEIPKTISSPASPGEKEVHLDCTLGEGPLAPGSAEETAIASDEAEKDVPPGMKGWICLLGVSLGTTRSRGVAVEKER